MEKLESKVKNAIDKYGLINKNERVLVGLSGGADSVALLHVLRGTDLAADYAAGKFEVLTLEHYIDLLEQCLCVLPPEVVIHRLTGDGAKRDLIAPLWSADKKRVLNAIHAAFARDDLLQGSEL